MVAPPKGRLPTEARSGKIKPAFNPSLSLIGAAFTALSLAYIAHYDFGFSREEIRTPALIGAGIIAALVAADFFVESLRKRK